MRKIYFTVTNDLSYDQRMQRICDSLATAGYDVTLVGRRLRTSKELIEQPFYQKRLKCIFNAGPLFYLEYNLRLFFYLLGKRADALCAIDLDTILPVLLVSRFRGAKCIYDAHEYFTEMKEVRTRSIVHKVWSTVASMSIPRFKHAYTVSDGLAKALNKKYGPHFITISNFPKLMPIQNEPDSQTYLFFGGAVNEARAFEYLIPAMQYIDTKLVIVGDGNFMPQLKVLLQEYGVEDKVELKGMLPPQELRFWAEKATLGLGLAESEGVNQYWALPNKFTDYMHAGLPQITMRYPEYERINIQFKVAVLIDNLDPVFIAETINATLKDKAGLLHMRQECLKAREIYNWATEEQKLLEFYYNVFHA